MRMYGCREYVHVGCFEDACKGDGGGGCLAKGGVERKGGTKCRVCGSFWGVLQGLNGWERRERVGRFLGGVVPWRR